MSGIKCDHVRYPNHPQRANRKKCGAELMKKVKIGQKYKLVARKTFVYYSIIDSIKKLNKVPDFLNIYEEWRTTNVLPGWLTDVYDGQLWKDWMKHDGVPFLEVPAWKLYLYAEH